MRETFLLLKIHPLPLAVKQPKVSNVSGVHARWPFTKRWHNNTVYHSAMVTQLHVAL